MIDKLKVASVHGRFQPFHNGHLRYVLAAKGKCEFLWIGITQINIRSLLSSNIGGEHRYDPCHNPMTYYERVLMITDALTEVGISRLEFGVIPFPIETPQNLSDFLPTNIPIFTTICEEWNREKCKLLRDKGYDVQSLWDDPKKEIQGRMIRELISEDDPGWRTMVPSATARMVDEYNIKGRLQNLNNDHEKY